MQVTALLHLYVCMCTKYALSTKTSNRVLAKRQKQKHISVANVAVNQIASCSELCPKNSSMQTSATFHAIYKPTWVLLLAAQVVNIKRHLVALVNMPMWLFRLNVQVSNRVLVKSFGLGAVKDMIEPRRVRETEYAVPNRFTEGSATFASSSQFVLEYLRRSKLGSTHDGNALWHHDLVAGMGV